MSSGHIPMPIGHGEELELFFQLCQLADQLRNISFQTHIAFRLPYRIRPYA